MRVPDITQSFIFEAYDVRGALVALNASYKSVLTKENHPKIIAQLLGEVLAAASLLMNPLKLRGRLMIQASAPGPLTLLMAECSSEGVVRALARYQDILPLDTSDLRTFMPEGTLSITLDPEEGERYQGIVALEETMAKSLNNYFNRSAQLPTQLWLYADGKETAGGLLLQELPTQKIPATQERANLWEHLTMLAHTLTEQEILSLTHQEILHRLYHEETIRLHAPSTMRFTCSCSRERSLHAVTSLGWEDAQALLTENNGVIQIDCHFCHAHYRFDTADVHHFFHKAAYQPSSDGTH